MMRYSSVQLQNETRNNLNFIDLCRRCLENQSLACMHMRAEQWVVCFLAVSLLTFLPAVQADDDTSTANVLTNGVSTNGYVCYDDGCSPNDEVDWWKIYAYKGDIVQVGFSGSMNNGAWWCPGDGWEADF